MTRAILADTGPLYAAADPDDRSHARSQQQLRLLDEQGLSVAVIYPTLFEAYTLIRYRLGYRTAAGWLDDMRAGTTWFNPSAQDFRDATLVVGRFPDQSITLFDASIATVAARLRLPVWTYDHHFDAMGSNVWR